MVGTRASRRARLRAATHWRDAQGQVWRRGPCLACNDPVVEHLALAQAGLCPACHRRAWQQAVDAAREQAAERERYGRRPARKAEF